MPTPDRRNIVAAREAALRFRELTALGDDPRPRVAWIETLSDLLAALHHLADIEVGPDAFTECLRQADFNYDGVVNLSDFNRLAANFGLSAAGPEVTAQDWARLASAVPEPTALGLTAVAAAGYLIARQRRCALSLQTKTPAVDRKGGVQPPAVTGFCADSSAGRRSRAARSFARSATRPAAAC